MTQEPNKTSNTSSNDEANQQVNEGVDTAGLSVAETQEELQDSAESSENADAEKVTQPATIGRKAIWVVGALVAIYFIGDGIIGLITK